ncbi:MAG: PepSY domain-containing protein [Rhodospirillaceae bacterium]|nr:PepSY domain-containing protein [Rhodospirillaceae bacterium]
MNRRQRRQHRLRHWHRWLGMGSLLFVVLLSVTGIVLNHADELELDTRFVSAPWLLDWYGIDVPAVAASYSVDQRRVTLVGERLYLDEEALAEGIASLAGAVSMPGFIAIATGDSMLLLTRSGALVERMPLAGELPAGVQAVGIARSALIVRSGGTLYQADAELLGFDPCTDVAEADVTWSEPSAVPPAHLDALYVAYRGAGVSVERLLADLHSGRLFTAAGPIVMDAAGVILIVLSVFGVMLWVRGTPRGNATRRNT